MKIINKSLYPLAKRALDILHRDHGEDKGLMVFGAWVNVGKNFNGEDVAEFYSVRDAVDMDAVEKSLEYFTGVTQDSQYPYAIVITETPINEWKKQQAMLQKAIREVLQKHQDMPADEAAIEAMYLASDFGVIKEGTSYGHVHTEDVSEIVERALRECHSVILKVSRDCMSEYDWDGHINIEILKTETANEL